MATMAPDSATTLSSVFSVSLSSPKLGASRISYRMARSSALSGRQLGADLGPVLFGVARLEVNPPPPAHSQHQAYSREKARDPAAARFRDLVLDSGAERDQVPGVDDDVAVQIVRFDRPEGVDQDL